MGSRFKSKKSAKIEKLRSCILDAPEEIFATVLNYQGKDPNSKNTDAYQKAETDLLLKLHSSIRYFHSSEYINYLANGDICVAMVGLEMLNKLLNVLKKLRTV